MVSFHSLPPEIRLMIYELALERDDKVEIHNQVLLPLASPHRFRGPVDRSRAPKLFTFLNLQRVSRLVQAETCSYFLSRNGFVVGSGPYGSSENINMHGFKTFLRLVPAQYLVFIKRIAIIVNLKLDEKCQDRRAKHEFAFQDYDEEMNLLNICRNLVKNFNGLHRVIITFGGMWPTTAASTRPCTRWTWGCKCRRGPFLMEDTAVGVAKAVKALLQHPSLEEIYFRETTTCRSLIDLDRSLRALLLSTPTRVNLHPIQDSWTRAKHAEMGYVRPPLRAAILPIPERLYGREVPRGILKLFGPLPPRKDPRRSRRLKGEITNHIYPRKSSRATTSR